MYTHMTRSRMAYHVRERNRKKTIIITNIGNNPRKDLPHIQSSRYRDEIERLRLELEKTEEEKRAYVNYLSETLDENMRLNIDLFREQKHSRDEIRRKNDDILTEIEKMKIDSASKPIVLPKPKPIALPKPIVLPKPKPIASAKAPMKKTQSDKIR